MPTTKKQRRWACTKTGQKKLGKAKAAEWCHTTNAEIQREARKKPKR